MTRRTVWRVTATPLTAPFIDSPRDARYHYSKRFGIASDYRLFEQAIATTTTRDPTVRLLYVVVRVSSYRTSGGTFTTVWRRPPRELRRLWWWPYKPFVNMIRRAAWTTLAVKAVPAVGHLTTDSTPLTTDRASQRSTSHAVASAADRRRQRQRQKNRSVRARRDRPYNRFDTELRPQKQLAEDANEVLDHWPVGRPVSRPPLRPFRRANRCKLLVGNVGLLIGSPLFGWIADRTAAHTALVLITSTLVFCVVFGNRTASNSGHRPRFRRHSLLHGHVRQWRCVTRVHRRASATPRRR